MSCCTWGVLNHTDKPVQQVTTTSSNNVINNFTLHWVTGITLLEFVEVKLMNFRIFIYNKTPTKK